MTAKNILNLDLRKPDSLQVVTARRGDTNRILVIYLSEGKEKYLPDPRGFVVLSAEKPDHTVLYNLCDIQGEAILYPFTAQTCACAGAFPAELRIYGADRKLLTTAQFMLDVHEQLVEDDSIVSENEKTALDTLMTETHALHQELRDKLTKGELRGESAYEEAVRLGFQGTEEQWLQSLQYDHSQEFTDLSQQVRQDKTAAAASASAAASEADRAAKNILNGVDNHNQDPASHPHLLSEVSRVESIARGRNFGVVFDTYDQMTSWLAVPEHLKTLEVGTNLYIRALNVPDYWWDGAQVQELEVEHPDLSQYVTKTQLSMELPAVVTQEEYDRLAAEGKLIPGRIYYVVVSTNEP